jgi:hypothetical protein
MSNSYRKKPITGWTTSESEKKDKRLANRKYRRKVKIKLIQNEEADILPVLREVSDVWGFDKDGKVYRKDLDKKYLRK